MDRVTLAGKTGRISLSFEYVKAGVGGDEFRGTVSIASLGLQAQGKVWFTAADVAGFQSQLAACYQALDGVATFTTHEENLKLEVVFGRHGRVDLQGRFQESHNEGNELQFRIQTDQSFIARSLEELDELVKRYGVAV